MKVGVPTEIKEEEYRVALTAVGARELAEHGHEILIQKGAGEGSAISDDDYVAQGARIVDTAEEVFAEADMLLGRQGAAAGRGRDAPSRADPLHLPAPGSRSRTDRGPLQLGRDLHRLRDGRGRQRRPAAARADERDRRPAGDPVRRVLPREADGRPGHPARRRPRSRRGERHGDRRRGGRDQRRADRGRDGGRRLPLRPQHRRPAARRPPVRRLALHRLQLDPLDREDAAEHGPRDRRCPRPGRSRSRT